MAAQKAFLNNFSVKLANNKKLFIISCVLSIFGMPMMVLGKVLEIYELEQSKINPEIYQYTGYEYYSLISVAAMVILLAVVIITAFNIFHYLYVRKFHFLFHCIWCQILTHVILTRHFF